MPQAGVCAVLALVLALTDRAARADSPTAPTSEQKAAARMLGTEGVKLALAGDCAGAVDKLSRAEALLHAPTTAVPLGQCEIKLGKLVAGTEILNRVLRESLPEGSPKSWVEAKQRAQALFDAASPRIAKLRLHIDRPPSGSAASDLQVAVDGDPVPAVLLDNDRPTDPGAHHVTAQATGFAPASTDVTLSDGQTQSVSLRLEPTAPLPQAGTSSASVAGGASATGGSTAAAGGSTAPSSSSAPSARRGPNRVPAYVSFGVGGAGVLVGTIFGALALSAKSTLDSACMNKVCPTTSQGDIDSLHTDAVVSTVGWGVGFAGAAVGVILFFTAGHGEEGSRTAGVDVQPWLGPGSAGLSGSFQ
jgi:hypothetical protein